VFIRAVPAIYKSAQQIRNQIQADLVYQLCNLLMYSKVENPRYENQFMTVEQEIDKTAS